MAHGGGRSPQATFSIEFLDDNEVLSEIVELRAVDACGQVAVSALPSHGMHARFVHTHDGLEPSATATIAMTIVVGDLATGKDHFLTKQPSPALRVAVVAIDPNASREAILLTRQLDAVLPVTASTETALASALTALTAFLTADRVSLSVDDVYPFFTDAGALTWGEGSDERLSVAVRNAAETAHARGRCGLLHIQSTERDCLADLRFAGIAAREAGFELYGLSLSVAEGSTKRASVITRGPRSWALTIR